MSETKTLPIAIHKEELAKFCQHHNIRKLSLGRISAECRARHPEIPWAVMVGRRNRLTHAYFSIDLDIVWLPN